MSESVKKAPSSQKFLKIWIIICHHINNKKYKNSKIFFSIWDKLKNFITFSYFYNFYLQILDISSRGKGMIIWYNFKPSRHFIDLKYEFTDF
jgi:hypothetical protein